jgi:hypothetical protein
LIRSRAKRDRVNLDIVLPDAWPAGVPVRLALVVIGVAVLGGAVRAVRTPEPFVDRSVEVAIGRACRNVVEPGASLVVDTPDYGYFAVIAAFGDPARAITLRSHDPREGEQEDPYDAARRLSALFEGDGGGYLVAPRSIRTRLAGADTVVAERGDLVLVRVGK